jgi:N-acetylglucosaminyldiphosphoundecaprenol N-acetyl-beta-D-mannosaminyltransferase
VEIIGRQLQSGSKGYICVTGVHGIMEARRNPEFLGVLSSAFLVVPDGMPTVWVGRLQGHRTMARVFGPDLMLDVFKASVAWGTRHFFYGGQEGVAEELKARINRLIPEINIVGTYTPPFRPLASSEKQELSELVARTRPDIIWVGLSTPKQERFMAEYLPVLETKLMVGVGAAFDLHTGRIRDCDDWIKRAGLQWLHRLNQEPRRLWKRYLVNNPKFLLAITGQLLGLKKYRIENRGLLQSNESK